MSASKSHRPDPPDADELRASVHDRLRGGAVKDAKPPAKRAAAACAHDSNLVMRPPVRSASGEGLGNGGFVASCIEEQVKVLGNFLEGEATLAATKLKNESDWDMNSKGGHSTISKARKERSRRSARSGVKARSDEPSSSDVPTVKSPMNESSYMDKLDGMLEQRLSRRNLVLPDEQVKAAPSSAASKVKSSSRRSYSPRTDQPSDAAALKAAYGSRDLQSTPRSGSSGRNSNAESLNQKSRHRKLVLSAEQTKTASTSCVKSSQSRRSQSSSPKPSYHLQNDAESGTCGSRNTEAHPHPRSSRNVLSTPLSASSEALLDGAPSHPRLEATSQPPKASSSPIEMKSISVCRSSNGSSIPKHPATPDSHGGGSSRNAQLNHHTGTNETNQSNRSLGRPSSQRGLESPNEPLKAAASVGLEQPCSSRNLSSSSPTPTHPSTSVASSDGSWNGPSMHLVCSGGIIGSQSSNNPTLQLGSSQINSLRSSNSRPSPIGLSPTKPTRRNSYDRDDVPLTPSTPSTASGRSSTSASKTSKSEVSQRRSWRQDESPILAVSEEDTPVGSASFRAKKSIRESSKRRVSSTSLSTRHRRQSRSPSRGSDDDNPSSDPPLPPEDDFANSATTPQSLITVSTPSRKDQLCPPLPTTTTNTKKSHESSSTSKRKVATATTPRSGRRQTEETDFAELQKAATKCTSNSKARCKSRERGSPIVGAEKSLTSVSSKLKQSRAGREVIDSEFLHRSQGTVTASSRSSSNGSNDSRTEVSRLRFNRRTSNGEGDFNKISSGTRRVSMTGSSRDGRSEHIRLSAASRPNDPDSEVGDVKVDTLKTSHMRRLIEPSQRMLNRNNSNGSVFSADRLSVNSNASSQDDEKMLNRSGMGLRFPRRLDSERAASWRPPSSRRIFVEDDVAKRGDSAPRSPRRRSSVASSRRSSIGSMSSHRLSKPSRRMSSTSELEDPDNNDDVSVSERIEEEGDEDSSSFDSDDEMVVLELDEDGEEDIFTTYSWSTAKQDPEKIQQERKRMRDALRDSPLYRAYEISRKS